MNTNFNRDDIDWKKETKKIHTEGLQIESVREDYNLPKGTVFNWELDFIEGEAMPKAYCKVEVIDTYEDHVVVKRVGKLFSDKAMTKRIGLTRESTWTFGICKTALREAGVEPLGEYVRMVIPEEVNMKELISHLEKNHYEDYYIRVGERKLLVDLDAHAWISTIIEDRV